MQSRRKTLFVNGCSHAAGAEIEPLDVAPSGWSPNKAFGARLARALGYDQFVNEALPGGSNERIVRTTIDWIGRNHNAESGDDLFVVIMWTGAGRFEIFDESRGSWIAMCPGDERSKGWSSYSHAQKQYFKYHALVRTTPLESAARSWVEIIALQSYLKRRGIKHLFCNATEGLDDSHVHAAMCEQLDRVRFYKPFHERTSFWSTLQSAGFVTRGQGHYLEDGHEYWSHLLAQHIEENGLS